MHINKAKIGGGGECLQKEQMIRGSEVREHVRVLKGAEDLDRGQAEARRHRKQKG